MMPARTFNECFSVSNETKVGTARCAVPAAFSGGTISARSDRAVKRQFRASTVRGRRSAASLPPLPCEISGSGDVTGHEENKKIRIGLIIALAIVATIGALVLGLLLLHTL